MPDIFSIYRPYDSRNYRSVSRNYRSASGNKQQIRYPSKAERDLFAKFNQTGLASDYPTYEQWKAVYPSNNWNRDLYNKQKRIKLGNAQPAENTSSPIPIVTYTPYYGYDPYLSNTIYDVRTKASSTPSPTSEHKKSVRLASQEITRPDTNPRYSEGFMMHGDRPTAAAIPSPTNAPQKSVLPASATKGKTVAEIWTSVTGLPWKAAKEIGLTDGSYANNIEILKGLKNGSINKEYINNLVNGEGVTTEDASYAPGSYPAPTVFVPEARPFGYTPVEVQPVMAEPELKRPALPAGVMYDGVDMTAPTEMEANMAARGGRIYGYDPIWDVYYS